MDQSTALTNLSPLRQTGIVALIAVALSLALSGTFYLGYFGKNDQFWGSMIIAIIVPVAISVPIGWHFTNQRQRLVVLANRLRATQGALRQANRELARKASYDSMTGMLNRDGFFDHVGALHKEDGEHVLMIVDVDHFKNINDSFGHLVGDKALTLLSEVFEEILRESDVIGRIGGEEFGIFLPITCEAEGRIIAEMIRQRIESTVFEPHPGFRHVITVSIGMTCTTSLYDRAIAMRNADNALFAAKNNGRNCVVLFEPGMRPKPRPTVHNTPHDQAACQAEVV